MESVNNALPQVKVLNNELFATIAQKTKEINDAKAELVKNLQPTFKELFVPFLNKYPEVQRIQWEQYTPYFNDGEPCEFSVNDLHGFLGTEDECEYEGSLPDSWADEVSEFRSKGLNPEWSDWTKKRIQEIAPKYPEDISRVLQRDVDFSEIVNRFKSIPEDVMKDLFGDHARIVVTKDGLEIEECEHD